MSNVPLNPNELIVTQNGIRDNFRIPTLIKWIRDHGLPEQPVLLVQDGSDFYIHDGHTRIYCAYKLGIPITNYRVLDLKIEDYQKFNWDKGFCTPFNPKTEIRSNNFFPFKEKAMSIYRECGSLAAEHYVNENANMYKMDRTIAFISDFI